MLAFLKSIFNYLFTDRPLSLPDNWREISRAEIMTSRTNEAQSLKGQKLMSDYDILTKWLKYPDDEAENMVARMKIQKLEDLKLQIMAQNPSGLIGVPA